MFKPVVFLSSMLISNFSSAQPVAPQQQFFNHIKAYCGQAFAGKVIKSNASDKSMLSQSLIMHVRECSETQIKVPFHVGDDRSRTWVISKTSEGLQLKHDHRHQDGSADKITMYGGSTNEAGSARAQSFPADEHSKTMFVANNMTASVANTWLIEIVPGKVYRYGLQRPGREFVVEFDLTKPVPPPPAPWGHDVAL